MIIVQMESRMDLWLSSGSTLTNLTFVAAMPLTAHPPTRA